jgi:hypothetical protein
LLYTFASRSEMVAGQIRTKAAMFCYAVTDGGDSHETTPLLPIATASIEAYGMGSVLNPRLLFLHNVPFLRWFPFMQLFVIGIGHAAGALVAVLAVSSCAQPVVVYSPASGNLVIDDEEWGEVPEDGVDVEISPGFFPVAYEFEHKDGTVVKGEWARSELSWFPLVSALIGVAFCVPFCAGAAFIIANPSLFAAPLFLLCGTCSGFGAVLASTSWCSAPCAASGATVGLFPLLLLYFAERVPVELDVDLSKTPPVTNSKQDDNKDGERMTY